ncbi:hypothetical protein [Mycobacteroides abscessus]|uniref:8-oxoguanine DNA glycosylase n=1 Tax=Mycobacteroides abscessus TaxID=36809 RepID=UPI001F2C264D|nr:hypothetical protein [Mycobacteroides abscessus]
MTAVQPLTVMDVAHAGAGELSQIPAEPVGGYVVLSASAWQRTVRWYDPTYLGTPAFWIEQTRQRPRPLTYQVGATLLEEVALCLLGGYGITEQIALAAFAQCRRQGLLSGELFSENDIHAVLSEPLAIPGRPRPVLYRFPRQKARRLSAAIGYLGADTPPPMGEPRELRDWLTAVPGVGPKTASWAVRNLTRSDAIAVIDIHIRRAGVAAGVFDPAWKLPRDYRFFEEAFVAWAYLGGVGTADLDACIWSALASLGRGARTLFGVNNLSELD